MRQIVSNYTLQENQIKNWIPIQLMTITIDLVRPLESKLNLALMALDTESKLYGITIMLPIIGMSIKTRHTT